MRAAREGIFIPHSRGENLAQIHYTRLFTDERGASCFEDVTITLQPGFSIPGVATTIFTAPFLASEDSFWIGAPSTAKDDGPHPAPRRMILVTTQ